MQKEERESTRRQWRSGQVVREEGNSEPEGSEEFLLI